ncbi:hypothetical protein ACX3VT_07915 [Aerococcus sanguinicola]|uniref:hypothetical protein n=1 Tax=unclassified Aerococcus TaxID=2618060 RepID=UPI0008A52D29|nr:MULTISPECIES: hypothetical protein [unclassified Aerococcus]KAB0646549.1 hypothetical protein F6I01_06660 [Aerococcus sanguinicola]MDK6233785.1 hypothetical protein [Aerococcus sp. UMB10185]MDK6805817.1 hypothetical protein [Aerococcus sp. UMB7834]MDK6855865.1 hypothetical protein [Aerococcus sp. UMB7533]MDK8502600.1 hypothetical protein [Aerococcus sp. UMB1112A]
MAENKRKIESDAQYSREINRLGRITSVIALMGMFMVPLGTAYWLGVGLDFGKALVAASGLIAIFLPTAVVENVSFYPILGAGAMYLSSITGNITNLKIPVTVAGQKIAGVEPGTDKGNVIAIICVGISSIVTIIILILGAFLIGSWLVPILNHPFLKPGFDQIIPALYGAITVPQILNHKKLSVAPILFAVGIFLILGPQGFAQYQSYILISCMIISVATAYFMYKKGHLSEY